MDIMLSETAIPTSGDILVVEDNPASMKLLVGILEEAGYKTRPALSGELALRTVSVKKPDLVLLDYQLPGMDGIEVCNQLQNDPTTKDIPIIFISSTRSPELKVKSFEAGAVDYVAKPIDPPEVLARIANHLQLNRLQKQLSKQTTELEMHRQNLELMVHQKTRELKSSEKKFRNLFQTSMDSIMVISTATGKISDVNKACENLYGYSKEEFSELVPWKLLLDPDSTQEFFEKTSNGKFMPMPELCNKKKDGSVIFVEATTGKFSIHGELFVYYVIRDITLRKEAEANVMTSLREKEVLLREIHHRVKNNMQVIVSLLRLHSRRTQDDQLHTVFDECRDRINAMSLIHEALYESRDVSQIDFSSYLKKLCRHLNQAYGRAGLIETSVAPSKVQLGMDKGIAVGMVVCELVSNSFKHAFSDNQKGTITIQLLSPEDGIIQLTVQDDGIGLPTDVNLGAPQSLGLDLAVSAIKGELGGSIEVDRDGGTKYTIQFETEEHSRQENDVAN